jgi:cytochrome P450
LASANLDERYWEEPKRFNIERRTNGNMGFGVGIHGCVGQVLARLEGEVLFETLLKKVRAIEFTGEPTRRYISVLQSFQTLPLRLIPN